MKEINHIIKNYIRGEASKEEKEALLLWLKQSPENRKILFEQKDIWDLYGFQSNSKGYDFEPELYLFRKKLSQSSLYKAKSSLLKQIIQIAAIVVIAFGLGWVINSSVKNSPELLHAEKIHKIEVPRGQVSEVFLADGTHIWINSASELTTPLVFRGKERVVKLSGEAYFEVARDSERPFKVKVRGQVIEVLGTSFNVRAYPGEKILQTTLTSGKIKLVTPKGYTFLSPNEQAEYNYTTQKLLLKKVNPMYYSTWKEGRFEFENENLTIVFETIERWYDVDIIFDKNDFREMYFSGVIKRNKSVGHFLTLLNHSIPIKYKIELDKIYIEPIH